MPATMYETLRVDREDHLTWLVLNRPASLNALNATLVSKLRDFFARLPADTETRVVALRGAGRAFCAGLDLKEHAAGQGDRRPSVPDALRAQRPRPRARGRGPGARGRDAAQHAAGPAAHQGVPRPEPRRREPRASDRDGGPQPGARRGHGRLPRRRGSLPREAHARFPRRVAASRLTIRDAEC